MAASNLEKTGIVFLWNAVEYYINNRYNWTKDRQSNLLSDIKQKIGTIVFEAVLPALWIWAPGWVSFLLENREG